MLQWHMKFFLFMLFCHLTSIAYSQTIDVRKANLEVARSILSTINDCGNNIWPGYDLKTLNFVFVDEEDGELVALSTAQNQVLSFKRELMPASALRSVFANFKVEGQNWMAINTQKISLRKGATFDEVVAESYQLAVHEAFHNTMQINWTQPEARGTFIPIKWEPRFYRAMIYNNLLQAFINTGNNQGDLSRARFWYDQWSQNFPEEVAITADGYEGTAKYTEILADTFRQIGCHASPAELQTTLIKQIKELQLGFTDGTNSSLDGEGYEIGSLAAFLLRQQNNSSWYGEVAKGVTPLAQLLVSYQPMTETVDDAYKIAFMKTREDEQGRVDVFVGAAYRLFGTPDAQYVSIPKKWRPAGSFSPFNFYVDPKLNITLMPMFGEMEFADLKSGSSLKSLQRAVYLEIENPCDQNGWSMVVAKSEVSVTSNKYEIKNKFVQGTLAGSIKIGRGGQSWLCAGE